MKAHAKMGVFALEMKQFSGGGWMEKLEEELTDMSICIGDWMDRQKRRKRGGEKHFQYKLQEIYWRICATET